MIRNALALLLPLCACAPREVAPPDTRCAGPCVADPIPHCVPDGILCVSGDDCPSGTNCTAIATDVPCASPQDQTLQCRPRRSDRLALQAGFGVKGMDIAYEPGGPASAVTWHAPPGTKFVACALFSCDPEIGAIADHTSGSQVIVNFDTCVVLFKVAQVDEGVFRLDEQNTYTGFAERCTAATSSPRLFSALVVGCWAYDDYHLVAASDLVAVPPPTLRGLSNVPQGGPCTADGQACYDTTTDTFGVCVGTVCSARCRTAADCGAWGLRTGTSRPGDPCAWSCRDVPNTDLGACVRTD